MATSVRILSRATVYTARSRADTDNFPNAQTLSLWREAPYLRYPVSFSFTVFAPYTRICCARRVTTHQPTPRLLLLAHLHLHLHLHPYRPGNRDHNQFARTSNG